MKKLLIVLLVLLALVVGGLLYADTRLSAMAEQHAEQEIAKALPQLSGVRVQLDGFPLTFDVLVRGKVKALHVTIDSISEAGLSAQDLSLDVQEISIDKDALVDEQRLVVTDIGTATAQGFVTDDEVSKAVKQTVVFSPGSVAAKFRGQDVDVKAAVVARTVVLSASLPGTPPLVFPLPSRDVLPCSPQLELLEGRLRLSCSIDELPEALARAMAQG